VADVLLIPQLQQALNVTCHVKNPTNAHEKMPMTWLSKFVTLLFSKRHPPLAASSNFDEIYNDIGPFEYDQDGFTLLQGEFRKRILWREIRKINVFKTDLMTTDRVDMEIITDDVLILNEEMAGWYRFVEKTKEIFPSIPKDWDLTIIHPAFATNYRNIYNRT
jgi:hypothetical protein